MSAIIFESLMYIGYVKMTGVPGCFYGFISITLTDGPQNDISILSTFA